MGRDFQLPSASQRHHKLPTISFTTEILTPGSKGWVSTCNAVKEAMEGFGFFVAIYDRVGSELMSRVFAAVKELFDLPVEIKSLYSTAADKPGAGYFRESPSSPLLETMAIGDSTTLEAVQSLANLMWPSGNDDFCESIHGYTKQVSELQGIVTRMIFESYGIGKYSESHIDSTYYLLRANFYEAARANGTNVGIRPHTDTTFVTTVKQDEVQGLEVQYPRDGSWIPVDLPPSSFAVMAGDALLAWSNGRIRPCDHRVIMAGKARISLGLFGFHKGIIKVPEELADDDDDDGILRFNSFEHFGLLRFRAKNHDMPAEQRVKAYCGVKFDV